MLQDGTDKLYSTACKGSCMKNRDPLMSSDRSMRIVDLFLDNKAEDQRAAAAQDNILAVLPSEEDATSISDSCFKLKELMQSNTSERGSINGYSSRIKTRRGTPLVTTTTLFGTEAVDTAEKATNSEGFQVASQRGRPSGLGWLGEGLSQSPLFTDWWSQSDFVEWPFKFPSNGIPKKQKQRLAKPVNALRCF